QPFAVVVERLVHLDVDQAVIQHGEGSAVEVRARERAAAGVGAAPVGVGDGGVPPLRDGGVVERNDEVAQPAHALAVDLQVYPLRTGEGGAGADVDEGIGIQRVIPSAGRLPAGEVDVERVGPGGGGQGQAAREGSDR